MGKEIRNLNADEIECRVQSVKATGCILLLYKDARCDMRILDETFGAENWQRRHYECKGNLFCSVGIKFGTEWVWKDDCGTESNTEKEKGESSDSYKRSCFNWGIGRELYTSPFIWVTLDSSEIDNGKLKGKVKFHVSKIVIEDKKITSLTITDQDNKVRFFLNGEKSKGCMPPKEPIAPPKEDKPKAEQTAEPKPDAKAPFTEIKKIGDMCIKKFGEKNAAEMFTAITGFTKLTDIKISEFDSAVNKITNAKSTV